MNEVVTLRGVRAIERLPEKDRPKNWKKLVINYLQHKENWIIKLTQQDRTTYQVMLDYTEAVEIAKRMGIVWKVNLSK